MKRKMIFVFLCGLIFSLGIMTDAICAEPPTYDATGTWTHWTANFWTNCAPPPAYNKSGTGIINRQAVPLPWI